jgi:Arabinose-binding domain of AraC transcription regulator, N-term
MTVRADRLTKRAKDSGSGPPPEPSIPAHVLRVYIEAMARLGYNVDVQCAQAGVGRSVLERDPDARISCAIWLPIFQREMQPRPLKNFLFKAAAAIPIGSFPLLDYLIGTSDSVSDAVRQLKRYLGLVDNPHVIDIRDGEDPVSVVFVSRDGRPTDEFGIALTLLRLREEAGDAFRPSYISFQHMPEDTAEIEEMFGCSVRVCAEWNGFALSQSTWSLPLRRRDPILAKLLQQQADEAIARLPRMDGVLYDVRATRSRIARRGPGYPHPVGCASAGDVGALTAAPPRRRRLFIPAPRGPRAKGCRRAVSCDVSVRDRRDRVLTRLL